MQARAARASSELSSFLAGIRTGEPFNAEGVALVPLIAAAAAVDADLLEEGIGDGHTKITEVSEQGAVNLVTVEHNGARLLLLVDGEQVVGAKQNRIFNASFLVAPGQSAVVPVSCVERGRWRHSSGEFSSSESTLSSSARRAKLRRVTASAMSSAGYDSDQGAVWRDVDSYLETTRSYSATRAYSDGYSSRSVGIERQLRDVPVIARQVGVAAVAGSVLVGCDLFGSASLYQRAWKKVLRGVLAEVYQTAKAQADPVSVVERALRDASAIAFARQSAPGTGETLHGESERVVVGAVVDGGTVYHAVVAANE
jgi:hypothetical protein